MIASRNFKYDVNVCRSHRLAKEARPVCSPSPPAGVVCDALCIYFTFNAFFISLNQFDLGEMLCRHNLVVVNATGCLSGQRRCHLGKCLEETPSWFNGLALAAPASTAHFRSCEEICSL
jgi:hypothetical protein